MKNTKEPKVKTLECLVIQILNKSSPTDSARLAFEKMFNFFVDEDFLYGKLNRQIISLIYRENFYKYHYAYALSQILNIDNKTLLECRKNYLLLFAKHYLGLNYNSRVIFSILQTELKKKLLLLKGRSALNGK